MTGVIKLRVRPFVKAPFFPGWNPVAESHSYLNHTRLNGLSFGGGIQYWLGAGLGRAETEIIFDTPLRRYPGSIC